VSLPPDPVAERLAALAELNASPRLQAVEMALCSQDVCDWLSRWGWTLDPREAAAGRPAVLPFAPFPRQVELLRWLESRESAQEDGLVEKSREVGVTWLCCAFALHRWLFRRGYKVGFGSRKLELVDRKGDPDSIFEKLRFLLDNLPAWMLPPGFDPGRHAVEAKLINPHNGSTITGEGGDEIGRGGRCSVFFVDEAASLPHPQLADAALSQTTRIRIDVSTPKGPGNPFARKRFSGRCPVFTFHWKQDVRKGQDWYAKECARLGDAVLIAQELDIDYSASVEGIAIPGAWVRAAVGLQLPPSRETVAGWDVAEEGRCKNVLIARKGPVVLPPLDWGHLNTTEGAWKAADEAERLGASALYYDVVGPGMGVKGTFASGGRRLRFVPVGVNGGDRPTETLWPDGRTSRERFHNLRAELWWLLRCRFERAYEHVTQGRAHRPEDMVSVPDHPQLIAQLSLPLWRQTDRGRLKLESKEDMRRRGVQSPDFADALALAFAPRVKTQRAAAGGERPATAAPGGAWQDRLPDPYS
jgi:phage terminase large subunit